MKPWEFGRLVRRWRDGAAPETVGISAGRRRRAAGLRREELAALAGISTDYLMRLEQGRATSPSAQVVEALARALRLSEADRDLLYRSAGRTTPGSDVVPTRITASVQRLLDRLAHTPVAVFDAAGTLLAANAPYDALMGDSTTWQGLERNTVWRNLVGPGSRAVRTLEERAQLQARQVADLQLTAGRYPADRGLRHLVGELKARSPRFVELWESGDLVTLPDPARRKTIDHPAVGHRTLDCDTLVVAADDLRLIVYTAEPSSGDADRLAIVLGSQPLAGQLPPQR